MCFYSQDRMHPHAPMIINNPNKIIIGALTAKDYELRRSICHQSWFDKLNKLGFNSLFVFGDGNDELIENNLYLKMDYPDIYLTKNDKGELTKSKSNLFNKVANFCRWCIENTDFLYLFKCDDDTFIETDKFINYKPTHDYIGKRTLSLRYDRNPNGSFVYKKASTYAVGGIGYFLSRKSAEIIVNYKDFQAEETDRSEDCIVGKILRKHSIKPEEMIDLSKHGKI